MKLKKILLLTASIALLSSCGGDSPKPDHSGEGFSAKVGYEFEDFDYLIDESFRDTVENMYSNPYIEFSDYNSSYRFSYTAYPNMGRIPYDELGHFTYNKNKLATTYEKTLMYGKTTTSTQEAFAVNFTFKNEKVIAHVTDKSNTSRDLASFTMKAVEKRKPAYATDYTHFLGEMEDWTNGKEEDFVDKFRGSVAYIDANMNFYFTYIEFTNRGVFKAIERGVVTEQTEGGDPNQLIVHITRLQWYEYRSGDQDGDWTMDENYTIELNAKDMDYVDSFILYNRKEGSEWRLIYLNNSEEHLPDPDFPL